MGIIVALVIGLVAGVLAKVIMPGRDGGGVVATAALGIAGAVLAFGLGRVVGWGDTPGLIASTIGAIVILGAYRVLAEPRPR